MTANSDKVYSVKRKGKTIEISKEALKALNLRLVLEFQTATPVRKGEILSEYFDMNKSFLTYFPMFNGDYREEIINTFVTMMPYFFMKFKPSVGIDINSYLSMFCKKHAVRQFLFLNNTVHYNKFMKDEFGRTKVEKAVVFSMDAMADSQPSGENDYHGGGLDVFMGEHVYDTFLNGNEDAASTFLVGVNSYSRHFKGLPKKIVEGFESGLKWLEVMQESGLTMDKFVTMIVAVRMKLQRLMYEEGRYVRVLSKNERVTEKRRTEARRKRREAASGVLGDSSLSEAARGLMASTDRPSEGSRGKDESVGRKAPNSFDRIWSGGEEAGAK